MKILKCSECQQKVDRCDECNEEFEEDEEVLCDAFSHFCSEECVLSNFDEGTVEDMQKHKGFDISKYSLPHFKGRRKDQILRNCVEPNLGLHIFKMAFKEKQKVLI